MKKKILIPGIIVVGLGVGAYLLFGRGGGEAYEFRLDTITRGDISMTVTATGTINAVTQVEVGTQVSGIISRLYADFNSIVKEGPDLPPAGGEGCGGKSRAGAGPVRRCEEEL
jgi:HlyD family secretion protein